MTFVAALFDTETQGKTIILAILAATFAMFLWGKWRHDMVAVAALLACVMTGVVPGGVAFAGFGHPAVITVACVLILSGSLQTSGAINVLARVALPQNASPALTVAALTGLAAVLSAFMNNVGALALLMPIGLHAAERAGLPPGRVLMPLAFGSILGGMATLIGTPPNLIVSSYRAAAGLGNFTMFDFTPVGMAVAVGGVAFVVWGSRWLVPDRDGVRADGFDSGAYLTEARVIAGGRSSGMTLREIDLALESSDSQVLGLIRDDRVIAAPSRFRRIGDGDILVIEAQPEGLGAVLSDLGLRLEEAVADRKPGSAIRSDEVRLAELVVLPGSDLSGRSASDIHLRTRFGVNLLAISRQGRRSIARLRTTALAGGDVMLMQGTEEELGEFAGQYGCVPLAARPLQIPDPAKALKAAIIMAATVAVAASGLVPAAASFMAGVLAVLAFGVVSPRLMYRAVDFPVIVMLAALIPVAGAMSTTGAADLIARVLMTVAQGHAVVALALILIVTMTLSDFMNNAATAAAMCPIAIGTATQLGHSADPFLMAVAIGASCAFLTPIGHQNNTLILGPGGFRFGDYWRLGLPLEIIVVAIALPMLLVVWPL